MKRYEALAGDIETSIRSGLLQPGDRLPSVRSLCSSRGIGVAPRPIFSALHGFRHCLRLNYGHGWDARIEGALETLGQLAHGAR